MSKLSINVKQNKAHPTLFGLRVACLIDQCLAF